MTRILILTATVLALATASGAGAVGPSLGTIDGAQGVEASSGDVSYVTHTSGSSTKLTALTADGRVLRSATIAGSWGVPLVTLNGGTGGLSPNGRLLVLGEAAPPGGGLRARSRFAIVDTRTLARARTIALPGDYSFDALSPKGTMLYLIRHVSQTEVTRYRVRAYDLEAGRLLPGVIADRSQASWIMDGMPVTRTTSANGRWVYTLYQPGNNYPFVHVLDTVHRTAVCVALPWDWSKSGGAIMAARLSLEGGSLQVAGGNADRTHFSVDLKSFHVSASGTHTTA